MITNQCPVCKHYLGDLSCEAYPDGIPEDIITGQFDHKEQHNGDNGIRFEQLEKKPQK